jgi:hypothetical protein
MTGATVSPASDHTPADLVEPSGISGIDQAHPALKRDGRVT